MDSILIRKFAEKFYLGKDTMHDLTHIDRILRKAKLISKGVPHDRYVLEAATYFHGCIYSHENEIRRFLANRRIKKQLIESIVQVAWESQKESRPKTQEGKILHDAHILEGDEFFIITKCLVTGTARGQSLAETIHFLRTKTIGKLKCALPSSQKLLRKRESIAKKFVRSIESEI